MRERTLGVFSKFFRVVPLLIMGLTLLMLASGVILTQRGRAAMVKSDEAFHQRKLRVSIVYARQAALAYVPGSPHVTQAWQRLEAIGRGAESENHVDLARIAWDTLRVVQEQTDYPGRSEGPYEAAAQRGLQRLARPQAAP